MFTIPKVLATDLDGTLIPLAGNDQNQRDLLCLTRELSVFEIRLVYATGRHFASVQQAMSQYCLPPPDWIICDVGTSLYHRLASGDYQLSTCFADHLQQIVGEYSVGRVAEHLSSVAALQPQETEKQGLFKLSFYSEAEWLSRAVAEIEQILQQAQLPYSVIASVDPFEWVGLIDLLPKNVSKAYALQWWSQSLELDLQDVIFAGDSGNDAAALAAGYRAIIVGNAAPEVLAAAQQAHARAGLRDRIYAAKEPATSGVLAGLRYYLSSQSPAS